MMESSGVLGMVSKKDRRHSGYITPRAMVSPKELRENDLFIEPCYDDWSNYRDGMRDRFRDFKLIKKGGQRKWWCEEQVEKRRRMNLKQKKLLQRRKARKKNF